MTIAEILLLSMVQGLTEFIPVSSSGHLLLTSNLFGIESSETSFNTYILIMHFGTLVALIFHFRHRILNHIKALTGKDKKEKQKTKSLFIKIALGCIPIFIAGLLSYKFFDKLYENAANSSLVIFLTSIMLLIVGLLYFVADKIYLGKKLNLDTLSNKKTLVIGVFQVFALVHGVSRSGITIFAGQSVGLKKADAIEFSFLVSIPVVGAASVYKLIVLILNNELSKDLSGEFLLAFIASFIFGLIAIKALYSILSVTGLRIFGFYCISVSILSLLFLT